MSAHKHLYENLFSCKDCSDCEISADKLLFSAYISAFSAAILISRHAKALIFYLALSQDEKPSQTKNLQKGKSSDVLITNETKISKAWIIHVKTKNWVFDYSSLLS